MQRRCLLSIVSFARVSNYYIIIRLRYSKYARLVYSGFCFFYFILFYRRLNIDPSDEPGEERVSLCECALLALQQMHLTNEFPLIRDLLIREKAVTLSQVKMHLFILFYLAHMREKVQKFSKLDLFYCNVTIVFFLSLLVIFH